MVLVVLQEPIVHLQDLVEVSVAPVAGDEAGFRV